MSTVHTELRKRLAAKIRAVSYEPLSPGVAGNHATVALEFLAAHLTAPETVERVARVWTTEVPPIQHGQLCPCWTKKASADACDCFVMDNRRALAASAVAAVAAVLAPGGGDE